MSSATYRNRYAKIHAKIFQVRCFHVFCKIFIKKVVHKTITFHSYYELIHDSILLHFCVYVDEKTKKMQRYYDV